MAELPQNWIESKLEYIVWHKKGSKPKKLYISIQEGFVPYIDIKAFEKNILEQYTEKNLAKLTKPNNILVVWDGARAGLVGLAPCIGAIGSTLVDIEPKTKEIINKYLYYFLFSNYAYINSKPRGTGTPHVNPDLYWNMLIPLPPSNEQKRIVEKLDKMMRIVDDVKARLDKIPTALKRARQSILNQAITGELTKDWREKNNIKDTWKETSLKSIVLTYKNGLSKRSGKEGKATVVLRLADFCNHKIIKDNIREIKITDNEAKQYRLDYNDILIIRVNGSEDIVGRFILYDLNENWIYCDHLIRLKYDKTKIEPYYLFYYAQTNVVREYIKANVVSSAGQNTINQKTLDNMPLLLPSIDEQAEIVRRVKLAFEKLDKIELRYQKTKEYSDKLTQSILNKAFRGELVPQDPNDKPLEII
jgi:type I restriction enzyme S subunit